ncbi:MAG TPA: PTS sugar transporter subunit IIC, partial [Elusimicrobiales bacterium]|nr:PTS sugar transporter subunit IIC [Elusimicrobiales bacterium]
WTELLLLDQLPVGGYVPPSGGVCAATAFMMAYLCMLPLSLSFLLGLAIGKGYAVMESKIRALRSSWNAAVEKDVLENPDSLNGWMLKSLGLQFITGFVFIFIGVQFVSLAGGKIWEILPEEAQNAMELGYFAVPWIGVASLLFSLYSRPKAAVNA